MNQRYQMYSHIHRSSELRRSPAPRFRLYYKQRTHMSDGREERENREDRLDRKPEDQWTPERVDS